MWALEVKGVMKGHVAFDRHARVKPLEFSLRILFGPHKRQHPNKNEINSQESFRPKVIRLTGIEARVERGLPGRR